MYIFVGLGLVGAAIGLVLGFVADKQEALRKVIVEHGWDDAEGADDSRDEGLEWFTTAQRETLKGKLPM